MPSARSAVYAGLLKRVRERMALQARQLPNYTCTEHITRSMFVGNPRTLQRRDRVRLEVALAGGKELFAWPGERFEYDDPTRLTGDGLIGTGDFASFLRTIFLSGTVTYVGGEREVFARRSAVRFRYRVAEQTHVLRVRGLQATVSIHGSLLVDVETERLLALEVAAEDIPKALGLSGLETRMEFRPVRIGSHDLDMPSVGTLTARYSDGEYADPNLEQANLIEFRNCREYTAESTISFGEEAGGDVSPAGDKAKELDVPAGARFRVALEAPLDAAASAAGDSITATVVKPVRAGPLTVPEGARLYGRVLALRIDIQHPCVIAVLEFSHLEVGGARYGFNGSLRWFDPLQGLTTSGQIRPDGLLVRNTRPSPGPASFEMRGGLLGIPAGFEMEWVTEAGDDSARTRR